MPGHAGAEPQDDQSLAALGGDGPQTSSDMQQTITSSVDSSSAAVSVTSVPNPVTDTQSAAASSLTPMALTSPTSAQQNPPDSTQKPTATAAATSKIDAAGIPNGPGTGAVIALAVTSFLLVGLIAGGILFFVKRKRAMKLQRPGADSNGNGRDPGQPRSVSPAKSFETTSSTSSIDLKHQGFDIEKAGGTFHEHTGYRHTVLPAAHFDVSQQAVPTLQDTNVHHGDGYDMEWTDSDLDGPREASSRDLMPPAPASARHLEPRVAVSPVPSRTPSPFDMANGQVTEASFPIMMSPEGNMVPMGAFQPIQRTVSPLLSAVPSRTGTPVTLHGYQGGPSRSVSPAPQRVPSPFGYAISPQSAPQSRSATPSPLPPSAVQSTGLGSHGVRETLWPALSPALPRRIEGHLHSIALEPSTLPELASRASTAIADFPPMPPVPAYLPGTVVVEERPITLHAETPLPIPGMKSSWSLSTSTTAAAAAHAGGDSGQGAMRMDGYSTAARAIMAHRKTRHMSLSMGRAHGSSQLFELPAGLPSPRGAPDDFYDEASRLSIDSLLALIDPTDKMKARSRSNTVKRQQRRLSLSSLSTSKPLPHLPTDAKNMF